MEITTILFLWEILFKIFDYIKEFFKKEYFDLSLIIIENNNRK